jgi:hypothetical protein
MATMLLLILFSISVPLGYTVANIAPSGVYVDDNYRWLPSTLGSGTCSSTTASCSDCLADYDSSTSVCFQAFDGSLKTATMGELCPECPTGCGPFRDLPTMFHVMTIEFDRWPSAVRTVMNFLGTISFGVIIVVLLITWLLAVKAKLAAREKLVEKLKFERDLERMDKIFILNRWAITLDDDKANMPATPKLKQRVAAAAAAAAAAAGAEKSPVSPLSRIAEDRETRKDTMLSGGQTGTL